MTSFVPIKLSQSTNIIWQNESPSSTRYCRLIRFEFVHENTEISKEEYYRMKEEIKNLVPTVYGNVIVEHEMLLTMIDGKVLYVQQYQTHHLVRHVLCVWVHPKR